MKVCCLLIFFNELFLFFSYHLWMRQKYICMCTMCDFWFCVSWVVIFYFLEQVKQLSKMFFCFIEHLSKNMLWSFFSDVGLFSSLVFISEFFSLLSVYLSWSDDRSIKTIGLPLTPQYCKVCALWDPFF